MGKHKPADFGMGILAKDARALMAATADVAGDAVEEARKRFATAWEGGKELVGRGCDKTVERAKAANQVVRDNPCQTIAIAFGAGDVTGFLLARRRRK